MNQQKTKKSTFRNVLSIFMLSLLSACSQGDFDSNSGEGRLSKKNGSILSGKVAGGSKENANSLVKNGTIVRLSAGSICTGTMMASGWILTAAHCILNSNGTPKVAIKLNDFEFGGGGIFIVTPGAEPKATDHWKVHIHPTRDLALIHSIKPGPHAPTGSLIRWFDPLLETQPLGPNSIIGPIYGFGCIGSSTTELPTIPNEARMRVTGNPGAFQTSISGFKSWGVPVTKIPIPNSSNNEGVVAPGDSGGPGFVKVEPPFFLFGSVSDKHFQRLVSVSFAKPISPGGLACSLSDDAVVTTFDSKIINNQILRDRPS